jgi:hypothetical protein
MFESGSVLIPHFLFHLSAFLTAQFLTGGDYVGATILVDSLAYILIGILTFLFLYRPVEYPRLETETSTLTHTDIRNTKEGLPRTTRLRSTTAAVITLCVMVLAPIIILTPDQLYLGYVVTNVYHNPTITMAKPLALLLFGVLLLAFREPIRWSEDSYFARYFGADLPQRRVYRFFFVVCVALLSVLSALAKPSFTLCLLPAVLILILVYIAQRKSFDWTLVFAGIVLPSIAVLVWQYSVTYSQGSTLTSSSVIFAPFLVIGQYVDTMNELLIRFFMSVAFPAVVTLVYFKNALADRYLRLGWLLFSIGAFYTYFLAETGDRLIHGNFVWGAQLTLYILFMVTSRFFVVQSVAAYQCLNGRVTTGNSRSMRWGVWFRLITTTLVFMLHVVCGVWWYISQWYDPQYLQ